MPLPSLHEAIQKTWLGSIASKAGHPFVASQEDAVTAQMWCTLDIMCSGERDLNGYNMDVFQSIHADNRV